jgi:hypothetical protein
MTRYINWVIGTRHLDRLAGKNAANHVNCEEVDAEFAEKQPNLLQSSQVWISLYYPACLLVFAVSRANMIPHCTHRIGALA